MTDQPVGDHSAQTEKSETKTLKYIIIGLLAFIGVGVFFVLGNGGSFSARGEMATISGEVDFNGIGPNDAQDPREGEIILKAREYNSGDEYEDTGVTISFEDESHWVWNKAESGVTYDLMAEVYYEDFLIKKSKAVVASAPAQDLQLTFNISQADIPQELLDKEGSNGNLPVDSEYAVVSGTFVINGYLPSDSTIRIYARKKGDAKFEEVRTNIPARNGAFIEFDQAVRGQTYELQAELYNSAGTFIGESSYLTVTAPAKNETIVINSQATPPASKATISGNILLHGQIKDNSSVLVLQRKHGESSYSEIARLPAKRNVDFKWSEAESGVHYDITAVVQVNENNDATGNVQTVAAPSSKVKIEIDTNFNIPAPDQKPKVDCGVADSTNHYNAKISLPQREEAAQYYLQVGTSAGTDNIYKGSVSPNSDVTVYVQGESPHFSRYAYTACADCEMDDKSNWSGWSPTLGFQCPNPTPFN